ALIRADVAVAHAPTPAAGRSKQLARFVDVEPSAAVSLDRGDSTGELVRMLRSDVVREPVFADSAARPQLVADVAAAGHQRVPDADVRPWPRIPGTQAVRWARRDRGAVVVELQITCVVARVDAAAVDRVGHEHVMVLVD